MGAFAAGGLAAGGDRLDGGLLGGRRVGGHGRAGVGLRPVSLQRRACVRAHGQRPSALRHGPPGAYDTAVMRRGRFPGGRVAAAGYTCRTTSAGAAEEEPFAVRCADRGVVVPFAWGV